MAHQNLVIPAILKFEITPYLWSAEPSGRLTSRPQQSHGAKFLDPLQVREDFLRLDGNRDEVVKFLNRTGKFYGGDDAIHPVSIEAVREWRNLVRRLTIETDFCKWEGVF